MANFSKEAAQMERLHLLIKKKATGSPKILAKQLNISERQLYRRLNELKDLLGHEAAYCRRKQTYYYENDVSFPLLYPRK